MVVLEIVVELNPTIETEMRHFVVAAVAAGGQSAEQLGALAVVVDAAASASAVAAELAAEDRT